MDFEKLVKDSWANKQLPEATDCFQHSVTLWSKNTFGDSNKKKKILSRLQGIQSSSSYPYSQFLQLLKKDLIIEYNSLLKIEKDYWKIHSRLNWLNDRDANTKFFHLTVINRRRKNSISFFKDMDGNWIHDPVQILAHTSQYFQKASE